MLTIPMRIPVVDAVPAIPVDIPVDESTFFTYDIAVGGLGFRLASDPDNPLVYETATYTKQQVDQAAEAGEQTLSNWWVRSQSSFHGGAGQLNLERADIPPANTHIRFDASKGVDPWTPGKLTRLPDTTVVSTHTSTSMCGAVSGTTEYVIFIDETGKVQRLDPATSTVTQFTGVTETAYAVCSDGVNGYAAGATGVWKFAAGTVGTASKLYSYASDTAPLVSWVKSRVMLATSGTIFELDSNATPTIALTGASAELRYKHPTTGWKWRCFAESAGSILAAGDANGHSEITQFVISGSGGTPVLTVASSIATLPAGERVLSMRAGMGSFLAMGTTAGIRIGQFSPYSYQSFQYGPLTLPTTETQFQVAGLATRDRFFYAAGYAYNEPGLLRIDTGTQVDQAGRFAYATDLVAPTAPPDSTLLSTAVMVLPSSGKLIFSVPGVGLCKEGAGAGSNLRSAWLRTSRIRYNTTEPKLFKFGRVRGDLGSGSIRITGTSNDVSQVLTTVGFTTGDPDEFALLGGPREWLQLTFELIGSSAVLTSYGVKALPGTRRQRMKQFVCQLADHETDRHGRRHKDVGSARRRLEELYALDAAGDTVLLQEFTIDGPATGVVSIDRVQFRETGRPTGQSDLGGLVTITVRTVDS